MLHIAPVLEFEACILLKGANGWHKVSEALMLLLLLSESVDLPLHQLDLLLIVANELILILNNLLIVLDGLTELLPSPLGFLPHFLDQFLFFRKLLLKRLNTLFGAGSAESLQLCLERD